MGEQQKESVLIKDRDMFEKPKNIVDATSQIQQYYTLEKEGTAISSDFLTLEGSLDLFNIGLKTAIKNGILNAITSPFMIGVFKKYFPVFGAKSPTLYDKIWTVVINYSLTVCYALFLAYITRYYIGSITRTAIRSLFQGIMVGAIFITAFVFILYHTLYYIVLDNKKLIIFLLKWENYLSIETITKIYYWTLMFKDTLILSSFSVLVNMTIIVSVPIFFMFYKAKKLNIELENRDKWQMGV